MSATPAVGAELSLDQIGGRRDPGDPNRGAPPLARPDAGDTSGFHEPRDALATDVDAVLEPELGVDPRRPVHASAGVVDPPGSCQSATRR
jgi:hypothetical protein